MSKREKLLPDSLLWSYSCNGIDKNGNVLGTMKVKTPDRHSPFDMRRDLNLTVSSDRDIPSIMDLPSFRAKIDWDNHGKKILPYSFLLSYIHNPDSGEYPGTVRVKTPDRHSPFDMRRDLNLTVSSDRDIPSIMDLPSYREKIVWD